MSDLAPISELQTSGDIAPISELQSAPGPVARGLKGFVQGSPIGLVKSAMDAMEAHPILSGFTGPLGPMLVEGAKRSMQNVHDLFDSSKTPEQRTMAGVSLIPGGPGAVDWYQHVKSGDIAGMGGQGLGMLSTLALGAKAPEIAEAVPDLAEAARAAAPDVATGAAKTIGGGAVAASHLPGHWLGYYGVRRGLRQMMSGIEKGRQAFGGEAEAAPGAEAGAPTEDMQLLDDIAQGQAGKKFASLDAQGQAAVRALAAKIGGQQAAPDAAPGPYVPRPPSYYGVEPTPPAAATPPQAAPTSAPTSAPMVPQPGAAVGRPSTVRPIPETQAPALTISEPPGNVLPAPGKPAGPVRPPIAGQPQPEATAPAGGVPPTEIEASDLEGLLKQSLENASAKKRTLAQTEAAMVQKQPGEPPATPRPYIEEHAGPKMTGRGFDMENINRAAKVQRFADKLREIGVGPDDIGKIPQGWMSDTQIRAGAIPGWGNIADYLGEGVPSELSIADIKNVLKKAK